MSDHAPLAPENRACSPVELFDTSEHARALIDVLSVALDHPTRAPQQDSVCLVMHLLDAHVAAITDMRLTHWEEEDAALFPEEDDEVMGEGGDA